jgi:hypothetical protein
VKALKPEQYAALLEQYIDHLDAEMAAIAAFAPSDIAPGGIRDSYAKAAASAALIDLWACSKKELAYQSWQAEKAQEWSEKKIAHQYI